MDRQRMTLECFKSVEEIKREIEYERAMTNALIESVDQWDELNSEFETRYDLQADVEPGGTWKTRYAYESLHNKMLRDQIKQIKAEIRMAKHGQLQVEPNVDWNELTPAEARRKIKALQLEITSLKGFIKGVEEKINSESYNYTLSKDQCDGIIKDIEFQQERRIRDQENRDNTCFNQIHQLKRKESNTERPLPSLKLPAIESKPRIKAETYKEMFKKARGKKAKERPITAKRKKSVTFRMDDT